MQLLIALCHGFFESLNGVRGEVRACEEKAGHLRMEALLTRHVATAQRAAIRGL